MLGNNPPNDASRHRWKRASVRLSGTLSAACGREEGGEVVVVVVWGRGGVKKSLINSPNIDYFGTCKQGRV